MATGEGANPWTTPNRPNVHDRPGCPRNLVSYRETRELEFRQKFESHQQRGYAGSSLSLTGGRLQRVCFLLNVRPEKLEEYKARHREVWPEMIRALRDSGWTNYSLFLRPDGLLIGYLETPDFERALAEMKRRDVNQRWQREMATFFDTQNGVGPDEFMTPIEEVFHLDSV